MIWEVGHEIHWLPASIETPDKNTRQKRIQKSSFKSFYKDNIIVVLLLVIT